MHLNVHNQFRKRFALKAPKQHVKISHTPSTIDQNQDLEVRIPNLGANDVIIPNSIELTFDLEFNSSLNTRFPVNNIAKALVEKMTINFEGNELQSIQNFDLWENYKDLWLPTHVRKSLVKQGLDDEGNINKIRLKTHNAETTANDEEKAIAKAYGNNFSIPLGQYFELTKHLPFALINDRLSFLLRFAPYSNIIRDAGTGSGATAKAADGTYKITNIALEFDKVEDSRLASEVKAEVSNMSLPYERVLRHRIIPFKKSDTMWNSFDFHRGFKTKILCC